MQILLEKIIQFLTSTHTIPYKAFILIKQSVTGFVSFGKKMKMDVKIKRVYEQPDKDDGTRILVDRLWPIGLTKEKAKIDLWLKEIAPTTTLRKWFAHDPEKWDEFKKRYLRELEDNKEAVATLKNEIKKGPVSLIYGAKDEEHNEALFLKYSIEKL